MAHAGDYNADDRDAEEDAEDAPGAVVQSKDAHHTED